MLILKLYSIIFQKHVDIKSKDLLYCSKWKILEYAVCNRKLQFTWSWKTMEPLNWHGDVKNMTWEDKYISVLWRSPEKLCFHSQRGMFMNGIINVTVV